MNLRYNYLQSNMDNLDFTSKNSSHNINQNRQSNIQRYWVKDEQDRLIGTVERIYRDDEGLIQIVFSLSNTTGKPLFRADEKLIQKADLENRTFIIKLSTPMREKLNRYLNQDSISDVTTSQPSPPEINSELEDVENSSQEMEESEMIRLLEERLVVNRERKKIGEVVVRKEIETQIIEVPVKREKLIVEKVGSEPKTLAEIDLSCEEIKGVEQIETDSYKSQERVTGEFLSLQAASELLRAIALEEPHGCSKVRLELIVNNPQYKEKYQAMFNRCTTDL